MNISNDLLLNAYIQRNFFQFVFSTRHKIDLVLSVTLSNSMAGCRIMQTGVELGLTQAETVGLELWIDNDPPIFAIKIAIKL